MPITAAQIEEAFGYPLFTDAQYRFMTETMRHHILTPWFHATKTDDTKQQMRDIVNDFSNRVFWHGGLFYATIEDIQRLLESGVVVNDNHPEQMKHGEEALAVLATRCKEQIRKHPKRPRMTLKDVPLLDKVVHLANNFNLGMCIAFGLPYVDRGLGALSIIVYEQIEFLQTLS